MKKKKKKSLYIKMPNGKSAKVLKLNSCSAWVHPFTINVDQRNGKKRRFYEPVVQIAPTYVKEQLDGR